MDKLEESQNDHQRETGSDKEDDPQVETEAEAETELNSKIKNCESQVEELDQRETINVHADIDRINVHKSAEGNEE